jgi:hypothetical protein
VVQHRERADRVERVTGEFERGGVSAHDLDVGGLKAPAQRVGALTIVLDDDQPAHARAQPLGRRAGPRPELEHVLAERDPARRCRENGVVKVRRPLGAVTQAMVVLVHGAGRHVPERVS